MQIQPETFRFLRQMLGISVREFAKAVGYSHSYVAMIETGERRMSEEARRRFLKFYIDFIDAAMDWQHDYSTISN
ncbi:hypothetical protein DNHGIG_23830 [Collibacillus ludicampi]|uniref:HTH cro/C1-type domain-containing protein n=1 Tax=Collibacillus ludicampi TaxID=2771369 RepID=A0AAV4LGN6_9BACL|nr:helix-turn-helix transcriptional regulator [Collibacillus ludicampi]GIM44517.1 hypothetical protein DNHGIG_00660 [Collibacillus ludicampi]GIM46834.1 hypothetical protein DNHGIG_23830 [Collibacillus ludicampi]